MTDRLAAAVAARAAEAPDDPAFTALSHPGGRPVAVTVTTSELHRAAGALAAAIRERSVPGDRVAIQCEHGLDYVVAFLGCLYSARTAVPLFPDTLRHNAGRLRTILGDAEPRLCLVSPGSAQPVPGARGPDADRLPHRELLTVDAHARTDDVRVDTVGAHPAYLQYTSGSTTSPAGVCVSHVNLAAALDQLHGALAPADDGPMVNWLPFFHDMGLVFALALPLYLGVHAITLPPADFAKRPIRWLRACSDYRATATASPNFGLSLAVSGTSAEERDGLDLSPLDLLLNGAEPIRATALGAFTRTFAPHGFRHRAHTAGYGLAEATLPVTISRPEAEPVCVEFDRAALGSGRAIVASARHALGGRADGIALVDCGRPAGQTVLIVDPITLTPRDDGFVGEIWVRGPNVGAGYAGLRERTAATFGAVLPGEPGTWLRTGDLGVVHNGGLYIAGRLRDTIVIDGRNHFPADIEATAADAAPELRPGHIAAFGVDTGEREDLVIIAEMTSPQPAADDLGRRVRAAVATVHGISPAEVLLLPRGAIPKTSSGKLRRGECRELYRAGKFGGGTGIEAEPRPATSGRIAAE
ncbi:fatty acyl-AMP ligase [Nocardia violaceofusca]|uniref:fatty acyl-AMP ligase n=1 Tax=Nocardia violaceofusca TaxID=941182 RepID=UPI0007C6AEF6|nr:fatty acyl-AMP ligase [Nocardia violaceofusca]